MKKHHCETYGYWYTDCSHDDPTMGESSGSGNPGNSFAPEEEKKESSGAQDINAQGTRPPFASISNTSPMSQPVARATSISNTVAMNAG